MLCVLRCAAGGHPVPALLAALLLHGRCAARERAAHERQPHPALVVSVAHGAGSCSCMRV